MKKFFTLIAAALMTMGAYAQGTYAVGEGTPADNEVVTSVPNITMTYGTGFKESSAQNALAALGFSYCTNGNDNPKLTDGVPTSGVFYKFEPAKNGTITTGIVLNADKPFFVTNSAADAEFTITKSDGTAVTLTDRKSSEKLTGGIVKFDVVANNTYYVYCTGSKLGFYGFIYEAAEGGDTPAPTGNVAGIYRPLDLTNLEVGDCSVAEAFGVKVTPIRGTATTYREEAKEDNSMDASDLYLGYSVKDAPKDNKAASAVYAADEVIFPFVAEQSARQENEFFGFTMEIPAGKSVNIDELDAYLLAGNAYQWQVEITDGAGNVVYKTQDKGIKINNYNKTAYTNGVHVTTTEVTEPTWSQEILESWSLAPNYDVTDTEVLPELKNLTGTYTVKVYYWGKWQKNLTYANVSLVLSEGEATGEEPGGDGNVAGIYRPLDLTNLEVGDCSVAEAFGVKVTPIRGAKTTYREEAKEDNSMDASDLYLGYSVKDAPKDNKAASAVYAADEVIFPFVAEQSARQEDEFFGFTMEIPAGTSVNIDELDAYLLAGNAYQWQVEITDGAGNVVYKTQDKGIKINNYNKTAYTNGVHVTTTEVTEPTWSQEILESWSLAPNYDVTDTEVLPELKNLTGTYTVKVYYWGKWQKNLTYANVSLVLSQGTTGISSAIIENTAKSNVMYNLAGQRISAPVSGQIYILNGKKYIAK